MHEFPNEILAKLKPTTPDSRRNFRDHSLAGTSSNPALHSQAATCWAELGSRAMSTCSTVAMQGRGKVNNDS